MKLASSIGRYLLGLMFTIFGLKGFFQVIHQPPPTNPVALQFLIAVSTSHFAAFFSSPNSWLDCCCCQGTLFPLHSRCLQLRSTTSLLFT